MTGAPPRPAAVVETTAPGRCEVRGALSFATARLARLEGERCLAAATGAQIEMDCIGVTAADSAGLAVLIEWVAYARRAGKTVKFTNLPAAIHAVARISEVEELLQQEHSAARV